MDPITAATGVWKFTTIAGEISTKLNKVWKDLKDREAKRQVEEIIDELHELKQSASALEDENRDLREKLRFKSDDYEFRTPFWYEKAHPERALCAKCFAKNIAAPMGEPGQGCGEAYRLCLVCNDGVEIQTRFYR